MTNGDAPGDLTRAGVFLNVTLSDDVSIDLRYRAASRAGNERLGELRVPGIIDRSPLRNTLWTACAI